MQFTALPLPAHPFVFAGIPLVLAVEEVKRLAGVPFVQSLDTAFGLAEQERIGRTVAVLRRTSVILGILGAVLLVVFSGPVSTLTFGSNKHAAAIALLSLAVLFRLVSAGQGALIQGMRRISDLAQMGVLGALLGTIISIPLVYFMGEKGVVPSLVSVAAMGGIIS